MLGRCRIYLGCYRLHPTVFTTSRHGLLWAYTGEARMLKGNCLTRFNKITIQGTPQMAVDKEAICLSRVYSYYPKCNFSLFYV